jgi:hypothetical protein
MAISIWPVAAFGFVVAPPRRSPIAFRFACALPLPRDPSVFDLLIALRNYSASRAVRRFAIGDGANGKSGAERAGIEVKRRWAPSNCKR